MEPEKPKIERGSAVLGAVEQAVQRRWERAIDVAASFEPSGPHAERIDAITASFTRELAAVGAAVGGTAAVPGIGTATALTASATELGWLTLRSADLIMTIAAAHGFAESTVEERKMWVLSVLVNGDAAAASLAAMTEEMKTTGLHRHALGRRGAMLRRINQSLARALLRRYGTRRGAVAVGKLLPFGVGAAIGGVANYAIARTLARQADAFFSLLPRNQDAIDVDGSEVEAPPSDQRSRFRRALPRRSDPDA